MHVTLWTRRIIGRHHPLVSSSTGRSAPGSLLLKALGGYTSLSSEYRELDRGSKHRYWYCVKENRYSCHQGQSHVVRSMVEEQGSKRARLQGETPAARKVKKASKEDDTKTVVVYDPATMRKEDVRPEERVKKIVSWNVAGLRAFLKKAQDDLARLLAEEGPIDIFCIQEHKLQDGKHCEDATAALLEHFPGYSIYWNCSTVKKGYSGTALLSKEEPVSVTYGLGIEEHDGEGRVITAEYDSFYVVNVYVPNAGEGLKRLDYRVGAWDVALSGYIKRLEGKGKAVILTGDMNCAAEEIDIHSPKTNLRSAGFTIEERTSFAEKYLQNGLKDAFRTLHPGIVGYTYWGYRFNLRAKNKGWRLDYFLVSETLFDAVHDCYHLPNLMGSDHAAIGLTLKL